RHRPDPPAAHRSRRAPCPRVSRRPTTPAAMEGLMKVYFSAATKELMPTESDRGGRRGGGAGASRSDRRVLPRWPAGWLHAN
ncbi:unnamed protein product, partial [Prorocentrum cordatum]